MLKILSLCLLLSSSCVDSEHATETCAKSNVSVCSLEHEVAFLQAHIEVKLDSQGEADEETEEDEETTRERLRNCIAEAGHGPHNDFKINDSIDLLSAEESHARASAKRMNTSALDYSTDGRASYTFSISKTITFFDYAISSCRLKLISTIAMNFKFTWDTATCTIGGALDGGNVYMTGKVCGNKKKAEMFTGPSIDVTTSRIKFEQCALSNKLCLAVRFVNKGGCSFNKWELQAKGFVNFGGYATSGSGWITVINEISI